MRELERTWLGWSFPPAGRALRDSSWRPDGRGAYCGRCGASAARAETTAAGCGSCRGTASHVDRVVRLGSYGGPLEEWIKAVKYRAWSEMGVELGRVLGRALCDELFAAARDGPDPVVIPMPMPWQRRLYRGIDHARVIASGAAALLGAPLLPILSRPNGPPQVALRAALRARAAASMRLRGWAGSLRLDGMTCVLVDDVRTSGATVRAASRLLRALGPDRLVAGFLAVADPPDRAAARLDDLA